MKQTVLLMFLFLILGCSDDEEDTVPTNVQFTVNVSTDGSGVVTVSATADNAEYFVIYFGEVGATPVETADGNATHTYAGSGRYLIYVRAHKNADKFASVSKEIDVDVDAPIPTGGYSTPLDYPGMELVWQDEFNGSSIDEGNWTFETGTGSGGWGNNELQYYTAENAKIQDGNLVITAKRDDQFGADYTSARMITKSKKKFRYGRIDVRAVLPEGQGIWPAIWMLGEDISTVGWPKCGEIDIMEMIGGSGRENTVHGTLHWDNNGNHAQAGNPYTLESGIYKDQFHVFSIRWDSEYIRWYVDDVEFGVIDITPAGLSEFHNEYFFILNVAVGGNWPGSPNTETTFPQHLIVDYIRVFQN